MASLTTRVAKAVQAGLRSFRAEGLGAEGLTTPRQPVKPTQGQGRSAISAYAGYVTSRERNPLLLGTRRYTTYDEMLLNTSIVAASVRYYLNMIARPGWEFDPVSDKPMAREYAEKTDMALRGHLATPWHRFVKRAASYRLYGYSTQEWIAAKQDDGAFAITDIQMRLQRTIERWDVDEWGVIKGVVQRSPHDGKDYYVPRGKLVYLVDDSFDDSPEGLGLFRHAVEANRYLSRFLQLEAWGYETDLKGMPIVRAPLSWLAEQVKQGEMEPEEMEAILAPLKDIVDNHVRTPDMAALLDSMTYMSEGENGQVSPVKMFDLDIIQGDATKNAQTAVGVAIERLNWDIARIFGTETLLLGANGRGAYALSKDKTQNLLMVVDGVLLDIASQVKDDLIRPLFKLNGWPMDMMPRPTTDAITYRDIESITQALVDMAKAGAILDPTDPAINVIRRAIGLPRAPEINRAAEAVINQTNADAKAAGAKATLAGGSGPKAKGQAASESKNDQQNSPGLTKE